MRRVALIALLVLACGPLVHAQMLSLAYAKGDQYNYKLHITSKEAIQASVMSMPIETDITAKETVSVKSVDSSGVADLSLTLSNTNMKMSMTVGQSSTTTTITKFPIPAQDVRIAPDGRLLVSTARA